MIEANRASSSAKDVSMMTAVFGWRARISRVASIPLPSASRTSITTTSGRARSAFIDRLSDGGSLGGHDDVIRGLQQRLHTATDHLVVVDEQDTERWFRHGRILPTAV